MIPKIIHFIYGLEADFAGKEFGFAHWVAIRSAVKLNPGYKIYYWYSHLPSNYYFEDVKKYIELRKIDPPEEIFGNRLHHVAHKADVVRLRVLKEMGGIYLDIDTITVKCFDDLLDNQCVMAKEVLEGKGEMGLCNAVILSEPNSKFINEWYLKYKTFRSKGRDEFWGEHSITMPLALSRDIPESITVLPCEAFFYPDWSPVGLRKMFCENLEFPGAYVHHLWESFSWGALCATNEKNITYLDNSYVELIKKNLSDEVSGLINQRESWVGSRLDRKDAKLNLGAGPKRYIGYINCDLYKETGADLIFDISKTDWPVPDDSVSEVLLHSVIEHFNSYEVFFKELYRVCSRGAVIKIIVPYPRHDWFLIDPTHVKGWHPESFSFLDKEISINRYLAGNSMTPLALYWGVDFKVNKLEIKSESPAMSSEISALLNANVDLNLANKYLNNVAAEIYVELEVRK